MRKEFEELQEFKEFKDRSREPESRSQEAFGLAPSWASSFALEC
jgi:hypothetical protein